MRRFNNPAPGSASGRTPGHIPADDTGRAADRADGLAPGITPGCTSRRHGRPGFTLIEMLVIIGIISLLVAISLPAFRAARTSARLNSEQSLARQLMVGYALYADNNHQRVLSGYAPGNFRVYDEQGYPIEGGELSIAKRRYPWRLAPYLDFDIRALFANEHRELLEQIREGSHSSFVYAVSVAPSLGLNTEWVGGDSSAFGFLPATHPIHQALDMSRFYVTVTSQVRRPDQLIVFASARGPSPEIPGGGEESQFVDVPVEGYFKITSPYFSELDPAPRWADEYHPALAPAEYGFLSPRFGRRIVTTYFDGSVGTLNQHEIRDMRYWANWATSSDWKLPVAN